MKLRAFCLIFTGFYLSCSPVLLTSEISNNQSLKLYREALQDPERYFLDYNDDSTYVICTLNDSSQLISQPVSFIVVNLTDKEKVFVSIKEYHKAQWIDSRNIRLVKYSGMVKFDRSIESKRMNNTIKYHLNVLTKELSKIPDSTNESF